MVHTFQIPEPAHVPGYTGHVPQYEYHPGESFGRATNSVLVDPVAPGSGRTVLTDYEKEGYDVAEFDRKYEQVVNRDASWGDQILTENMVVGYTGFVPKLEQHPGKHYAEGCVRAIADFMDDQATYKKKQDEMTKLMQRQVPLKQVAPDMAPYDSPQAKGKHWRRPFDMENNESLKFQISGYTGHVPCTRDLPGVNYPVGTHVGLNKFHDRMKAHEALKGTPVDLNKPDVVTVHTRKIFRDNAGTVSGYSGEVPGYKYEFGRTYGHATHGAKPKEPVLIKDEEAKAKAKAKAKAEAGGTKGSSDGGTKKGSDGASKGVKKSGGRLWALGDDPYCIEVILDKKGPKSKK